ncbi:Hypothetical predicted protein [Paramuricea clavata]|uniref:Uncharacterized protein n=1 Tax=Paramuricea clavata TaxID=317549 RepID=A0A6S7G5D0_PARCT|nr:Hypothetical predicted protein [Paramuricea clavata]
MSAGIFNASVKYYWVAICILVLIVLTIWYCTCRARSRRRREELLVRQRMSIQQLREEAAVPPSRYGSDAPPAYDDVINKPEDYPIYHAQATSTSQQHLPSYEEVIRMSGNFTEAPLNVPEEREPIIINMQQLEQSRTTDL